MDFWARNIKDVQCGLIIFVSKISKISSHDNQENGTIGTGMIHILHRKDEKKLEDKICLYFLKLPTKKKGITVKDEILHGEQRGPAE